MVETAISFVHKKTFYGFKNADFCKRLFIDDENMEIWK